MHTIYMIEYHDKKSWKWVFIPVLYHSKVEVNRELKRLTDRGIKTHVEMKKAKIPDFMKPKKSY